jgi:3',5'-cyclic AMP phosphodiesterase CpdA
MADQLSSELSPDGVDRRGFLRCMAWAGTGLAWTVYGGIPGSNPVEAAAPSGAGDFTFVQLSDSHIGFRKPPNKDVTRTLEVAVARINALPRRPDLLLHTGDLTHLARAEEFDTVAQVLGTARVGARYYVPGEHDVFTDEGKSYRERFGKNTRGNGWHSFDHKGCHFIGLVNVADLKPGGLGTLGKDQLEWLKKDVTGLAASTPIVVFAHVPLWTVYAKWGWGTEDAAQALALLKRFGSVTVLNGHVHQVIQKIEGRLTFHTACSTAFPQPGPGQAKSPGPIKELPADRLRRLLGLTQVNYVERKHSLAVVDATLK